MKKKVLEKYKNSTRIMDQVFVMKDVPGPVRVRSSGFKDGKFWIYQSMIVDPSAISIQVNENVTDEEAMEIDLLQEFGVQTFPKNGQVIVDLFKDNEIIDLTKE